MKKVVQKTEALPSTRETAVKKRTITVKEVIIDIASIPAFFVLFVIIMLYAGVLFLFRIKE